jgi:hypothetical protein
VDYSIIITETESFLCKVFNVTELTDPVKSSYKLTSKMCKNVPDFYTNLNCNSVHMQYWLKAKLKVSVCKLGWCDFFIKANSFLHSFVYMYLTLFLTTAVTQCVNIKAVQNKLKSCLHKESADTCGIQLGEGINLVALKQPDTLHDRRCQRKAGTLKSAP